MERVGKGSLKFHGDKGVLRPLSVGDKISAKYHGLPKAKWYPGTAASQNDDGSWLVQYDDMEAEHLHPYRAGTKEAIIMHEDGAFVRIPQGVTLEPQRKATRRKDRTQLGHCGFQYLRVDQPAAGEKNPRAKTLAERMHFRYDEEIVKNGLTVKTDTKYISVQQIVQEPDINKARVQQQALLDFFVLLYTSPPTSAENMQHLLGPTIMDGWDAAARKKVDDNFKVFLKAQNAEETRRAKKSKN